VTFPSRVTSTLRRAATACLAVALALCIGSSSTTAVQAQERIQRSRSILEFFGIRRAEPEQPRLVVKKRPKKAVSVTAQGRKKPKFKPRAVARRAERAPARSAPAPAFVSTPLLADAPEATGPVEKSQTAKQVLVIGDFMAGAVAEGLVEAFADNANVTIMEKANGSSGLTRDDFYNWPEKTAPLIAEFKPSAVIVMLGINDRQQMRVGDVRESVGTPAWNGEYAKRVAGMADALKAGSVPVIWVGQPALRSSQMTTSMIAFNDLYRKNTERVGGTFVDIWDGFVDEAGVFQQSGPDMNGLPSRLRGSDGISFSKAGKRKAAFFIEKPLKQILGVSEGSPIAALPAPTAAGFIGPMPPAPVVITRTEPMGINDPELDGGAELLGASAGPVARTAKTQGGVSDPLAALPKPGRVNDFSWKGASDSAADENANVTPDRTGSTQ
jgi:uncharacterized protein